MHTARNANTSRQAIGYVRVSTEQQADSGLSIAAQRVKLEALATLNDFQLVRRGSGRGRLREVA